MTNQRLADFISKMVVYYMEQEDIGVVELERRSGVIRQTLSQYANGEVVKIAPKSVFQILDFFDCELVIKRKDRIVG